MAPVVNGRHLFNEIPEGYPIPGKTTVYDTSQTIDLENVPLNGGFLLKILVLSIDPYMRGRMRAAHIQSYHTPFVVGEPLGNGGVAVVLRSENSEVKAGDHIYGQMLFQEYEIRKDLSRCRILKAEANLPWSAYVGAAGMPGKTAYMGWKEHADPQKGDVVFVTTGAGPVGSFVIQLAKNQGLKVIASAGSEEKVEFMKSIGADVAFNYKTTKTRDVLAKEGPINIYWDNVGGETLEAALDAAAKDARFIECGMISGYNEGGYPIKNLMNVVGKCLKIHGFIVTYLYPKYEEEFYKVIPPQLASGKIKYTEDITRGLENVGEAILAVQKGTNKAKSLILVAEE